MTREMVRDKPARRDRPPDPLGDFSRALVRLIAPSSPDVDALESALRALGAEVRRVWPLPELFPVEGDIVICAYLPGLAERLPWLPGEAPVTLAILCNGDTTHDAKGLLDCAPHGLLWRPLEVRSVLVELLLAKSQADYERRLRSRIDKLGDNLRSIRDVEHAKSVLMRRKSLSEEDAYGLLRRHAMERRVSIGALASAVIDTEDLLS